MATTERTYPTSLGALALLISVTSLCVGSAFAKSLFESIGPVGTTTVRIVFSTCLMWLWWRPWRLAISSADFKTIIPYGIFMLGMNGFFYLAMASLPIGIALAIQFSGPLAVAILSSRSRLDFIWVLLAVSGLSILIWPSIDTTSTTQLDTQGVIYALCGAISWAGYIVVGRQARKVHPGLVMSYGLTTASLIILPLGILSAGSNLFNPDILLFGLGIAVLSSALPYTLEIFSLRILPIKTFSIMLSLEPAIGAITAIFILDEILNLHEWAAILLIVAAAIGTTATAAKGTRK